MATLRKTASSRDISKKDTVDPKRKLEAQMWIQTVLGITIKDDLFDALLDGTVLCELINKIKPEMCKKYRKSKIAFVCRSNISIFIKGAKKLGIPETDIFDTSDLYDKQRLSAVVQTIYSVSSISRKLGFAGPFIGVAYADANKRHFTKAQLAKAKSTVPMLNRGDKRIAHKGQDSYGIVKTNKDMQSPSQVQSVWSTGSKHVKSSNSMDSYGIIKTDKSMQAHSNVLGTWQKGAKHVKSSNSMDGYGIIKTDKSMQSPSQVQSVWSTGSKKVESNAMDGYGIVKTDASMQNPSPVQSVWSTGSRKMESKSELDSYGIVKTNNQTHSNVPSVWEKGAKSVETDKIQDSYGIIKTTED